MIHLAYPIFFLLLELLGTTDASTKVGGIQHQSIPRPTVQGFRWNARLDRENGFASSSETSTFSIEAHKAAKVSTRQHKSGQIGIPPSKREIRSISKEFVSMWPDFLCQTSVTLGLFQARKNGLYPDVLQRQPDSITSIRPLYLPFSLLNFGNSRPCRDRLAERTNHRDITIIGCWEIPLRGGLLALPSCKDCSNYGKLTFSISKLHKSPQRKGHLEYNYQLSTHIVRYTPWLAGPPPVSRIRKQLYLHSQSFVHAYVTWRFHRAWQRKLLGG